MPNAAAHRANWSPLNEANEGRWRSFSYEGRIARDEVNLDIFWLMGESLEDSANLPHPDALAAEIVENLRSALTRFENISAELA